LAEARLLRHGCIDCCGQCNAVGYPEWGELGSVMTALNKEESASSSTSAQVLQLPLKPKGLVEASPAKLPLPDSPPGDLAREYERFQLQVQLDIESERELLYKSLLVVEVLAFLFVLREMLIRWLA
jgi:hypothetical protein